MKKIEKRTYTANGMEARDDDGALTLCGYAAKFDSESNPLPFTEVIQRGAFTKTLSESPDVRLLINHDGLPLARTKSGTLTLSEDETGLYFVAQLPDTQEARDLHTLVARGDVDQCSFSFRVVRQEWSQDRQNRKLIEVSLRDGDVSLVTYPAYSETSAEARQAINDALDRVRNAEVTDLSTLKDAIEEARVAVDALFTPENVVIVEEEIIEEVTPRMSLRYAQAIAITL